MHTCARLFPSLREIDSWEPFLALTHTPDLAGTLAELLIPNRSQLSDTSYLIPYPCLPEVTIQLNAGSSNCLRSVFRPVSRAHTLTPPYPLGPWGTQMTCTPSHLLDSSSVPPYPTFPKDLIDAAVWSSGGHPFCSGVLTRTHTFTPSYPT